MNTPAIIADSQRMLEDLRVAVDNLTRQHRRLAELIASPNDAEQANRQLDDIVLAIKSGNEQLEVAEAQRQHWVAEHAPGMDMVVALKRVDQMNQGHLLDIWIQLQPGIEVLHNLMQRHQEIVDRLAFYIHERVNMLTQAISPTDTNLYAPSGKTTPASGRQRSLGDA